MARTCWQTNKFSMSAQRAGDTRKRLWHSTATEEGEGLLLYGGIARQDNVLPMKLWRVKRGALLVVRVVRKLIMWLLIDVWMLIGHNVVRALRCQGRRRHENLAAGCLYESTGQYKYQQPPPSFISLFSRNLCGLTLRRLTPSPQSHAHVPAQINCNLRPCAYLTLLVITSYFSRVSASRSCSQNIHLRVPVCIFTGPDPQRD